MATFEIEAYFNTHNKKPDFAKVVYELTEDEAKTFPKYFGLRATNGRKFQKFVTLAKNGVNNGTNETGMKILKALFAKGATFKRLDGVVNSYESFADFLKAVEE